MDTRASRAVRGTALAAVATLLAAVAHTLGGGAAPSPLFCGALFVLAAPLAIAVAGARVSLWGTTAAVGVSQVLFHGAFSVIGDVGAGTTPAVTHAHHGTHVVSAIPAADAVHSDMTLAHLVAGIVTVLIARRGEIAIRAVLTWILRLATPLPTATVLPRVPRRLWREPLRVPAFVAVLSDVSRRGPPVLLGSPTAA